MNSAFEFVQPRLGHAQMQIGFNGSIHQSSLYLARIGGAKETASRIAGSRLAARFVIHCRMAYLTISLSALRQSALTTVRFGLGGIVISSPVMGLRPGRALVAGFSTRLTFSNPGSVITPGPFLPTCS